MLAESLGRASVFRLLLPGVADLLAKTMLRPATDGDGYELRCPSEHEAQIVDQSLDWVQRVDLGNLSCPVKVVPDTSHFLLLPFVERHV